MNFLYKVLKSKSLSHLFNTISNSNKQRQSRNSGNIPAFLHSTAKQDLHFFKFISVYNFKSESTSQILI